MVESSPSGAQLAAAQAAVGRGPGSGATEVDAETSRPELIRSFVLPLLSPLPAGPLAAFAFAAVSGVFAGFVALGPAAAVACLEESDRAVCSIGDPLEEPFRLVVAAVAAVAAAAAAA